MASKASDIDFDLLLAAWQEMGSFNRACQRFGYPVTTTRLRCQQERPQQYALLAPLAREAKTRPRKGRRRAPQWIGWGDRHKSPSEIAQAHANRAKLLQDMRCWPPTDAVTGVVSPWRFQPEELEALEARARLVLSQPPSYDDIVPAGSGDAVMDSCR